MGLSIQVKSVEKNFGTEIAVKNLSLEIQAGEFVSLVGPSGCGKSTLLNLMAGLDSPSKGEIHMGNTCLSQLPTHKRDSFRLQNVAFVFQFFHLLPTLNVLENICLPALEKKLKNRKLVLSQAKELLCQLGLEESWQKLPSQLSGGMLARAGLARALLCEPEVLFADEPTGSLDSNTGKTILSLIQQEHKRLGFTFVMVTHDTHAASLAKRVLKMQDGVLLS